VLVDERPEEVTELRAAMDAEILSSTFDEPPDRHVQVAEMALERARRLVEQGRDVVVFFDSLTRLARALNAVAPPGGRQLAGQVDAMALHRARRLFGAGRCLQEGGSLTAIATVLTGTQGAVDELLLEELEGTANAEIHLDVVLARAGIWPALDLVRSYSRDTGRLVASDELSARVALRATLSGHPDRDHAALAARVMATASNHDMLSTVDQGVSVGK
jgi:transcription termination factor Rho